MKGLDVDLADKDFKATITNMFKDRYIKYSNQQEQKTFSSQEHMKHSPREITGKAIKKLQSGLKGFKFHVKYVL